MRRRESGSPTPSRLVVVVVVVAGRVETLLAIVRCFELALPIVTLLEVVLTALIVPDLEVSLWRIRFFQLALTLGFAAGLTHIETHVARP